MIYSLVFQGDSDGEFDSEDIAKLNADRMAAAKTNSSKGDRLLLELPSGYSKHSFKLSDFPSNVYVNMAVLDTQADAAAAGVPNHVEIRVGLLQ